jgi:hypothetical protein
MTFPMVYGRPNVNKVWSFKSCSLQDTSRHPKNFDNKERDDNYLMTNV